MPRHLFASYGLPEQLVADNGPQIVAEEFATFLKLNGGKHIKCSSYHPSSNGLAERFVQTLKESKRAGVSGMIALNHRWENFLLMYRVTPYATASVSSFTLFLGREMRT